MADNNENEQDIDYEERIKTLEGQVKQLEEDVNKANSEKKDIQIKLLEAEQDGEKFREDLINDIQDVFGYTDTVEVVDRELLEKLHSRIRNEAMSSFVNNKDYMAICERLGFDHLNIEKFLGDIRQHMEKKDTDYETISKELKHNRESLEKDCEDCKNYKQESEEQRGTINDKEGLINGLNEELSTLRKTITEKDNLITDYLNQIKAFEEDIKDNDKEIEGLVAESTKLRETLENVRNETLNQRKSVEQVSKELEQEINELKTKLADNEAEIKNKSHMLSEVTDENDKLEQEINELKTKLAEIEADIKAKSHMLTEVTDENDKLNQDIIEMLSKQTEASKLHQETVDGLNSRIEEFKKEIEKLKKDIVDYDIIHKEELEKTGGDLKLKYDEEMENLRDKLKQLESGLGDQDEKDVEIINLRAEIDRLNAEVTKLSKEVETEKNNLENLNELYQYEKDSAANLLTKNTELNNELKSVKDELAGFEDKSNVDAERTDEVDSLKAEVKILTDELGIKSDKITKLEHRIDEIENQKDDEIEIHKKELQLKGTQIAKLEESLQDKAEQLTVLSNNHKMELACLKESYEKKTFDSQLEIEKLNDKLITFSDTKAESSLEDAKVKLNQLFVKLKFDLQDFDYLIDRRIIANVLIRYFDKSSSGKIKEQVLDTLANMLGYNNEDRKRIGAAMLNNDGISNRKKDSYYDSLVENLNNISEYINNLS
jgi:chromosome segregation ATPase